MSSPLFYGSAKQKCCSRVLQYLKQGIAGALEEGYSKPEVCWGCPCWAVCSQGLGRRVRRGFGGCGVLAVLWAVLGEELQSPRVREAVCGNGLVGVASLGMGVSQS